MQSMCSNNKDINHDLKTLSGLDLIDYKENCLIVDLGVLGDFDSVEYAQILANKKSSP